MDWGRRLTPSGRAAAIRHKLDLAGNPPAWDVDRVLAFKMLGLLVGAVLGVLLPLLAGNVLLAVLLGIGLAALGFYLPDIVLYQTAYNRSERIRRELPDALDLLVVSVEAGLMEMLDRMQTGRFKVFSTLAEWFEEFRLYHRKDGQVVKLRDDIMSATRYGVMMIREAQVEPAKLRAARQRGNGISDPLGDYR